MSLPPNPFPESPQPIEPPPRREPAWTIWDVLMILVVGLAGIFLFGTLIGLVLHFLSVPVPAAMSPQMLRVVLGAQFLSYLVVLFFMYQLVTQQYRRDFSEAVGWRWPERSLFVYLCGGVVLAILVQLSSLVLPIPKQLPIDQYFQDKTSAYLMSAFGIAIAPLVEELFYRGFLYPVLVRGIGVAAAVVLTAGGFALMHAGQLASAWAPLLVLFVVGVIFTVVRHLSRNVVPSVLMHIGYNATLFLSLYIATDRFNHLERLIQQP